MTNIENTEYIFSINFQNQSQEEKKNGQHNNLNKYVDNKLICFYSIGSVWCIKTSKLATGIQKCIPIKIIFRTVFIFKL